MVTVDDLLSGCVGRIKIAELIRLSGDSRSTIDRRIKAKQLRVREDETTKRLYILRDDALSYLGAQPHEHSHQNADALARMEVARAAKGAKNEK